MFCHSNPSLATSSDWLHFFTCTIWGPDRVRVALRVFRPNYDWLLIYHSNSSRVTRTGMEKGGPHYRCVTFQKEHTRWFPDGGINHTFAGSQSGMGQPKSSDNGANSTVMVGNRVIHPSDNRPSIDQNNHFTPAPIGFKLLPKSEEKKKVMSAQQPISQIS